MAILTQEQLNAIAAGSGYTGGSFSSVGLVPTTQVSNQSLGLTAPPTYVNPNVNYFNQLAPVSVLSSSTGGNIVNQNTQSLQNIESGYMGPSIVDYLKSIGQGSDYVSREKLAADKGITGYTGSAEQNTQLLQALRNVSSSPASSAMVNDINRTVQGGGMTTSERTGLSNLQQTQDELTAAAAKARAALESKDYRSMDYWTAKAEENRKKYENDLSEYYKSTQELRSRLMSSLTPGEKEQELSKKLVDIRSQAERFKLQTEQDKFREYEGQTLGFAGGRASEIDRKASFKNQEFMLQEKNLLLSLGLEQEARQYTGKVAELGLGFLADDFELQTKIQDRLDQQEEDLFNKANTLQDDAKSALVSILDNLQGINPAKMDAESKKQLEDLAARVNLPYNLIEQALTAQYNKFVFDQAKANKPTSDEQDTAAITDAKSQLTKAVGTDGYTDPNLYARLRSASQLSPTEFDNRFAYLVNPLSRAKLGLTSGTSGSEGSISSVDYTKGTNWLLNNGASADDLEKFKSDRDFQAWVMGKITE